MTKEQLLEIARAGFPERVKQFINFNDCEMHSMSGVYRLYHKDVEFFFMLPKEDYLTIFIGGDNFVQITAGNTAFNHFAAIKKMEQLGLVPLRSEIKELSKPLSDTVCPKCGSNDYKEYKKHNICNNCNNLW